LGGVAEGADGGGRAPRGGQRIGLGSRVRIFDGYGDVEFVIVPDDAAREASDRRISAKSPLGLALLGRCVGEEVLVRTRTGIHFIRIRDVA
jgi:transcription elongation GreA/GreB family factor